MTNNPRTPTDLAHALLQARHSGELLDADDWADVVRAPADAQAVQAAMAPALGWRVAGSQQGPGRVPGYWKSGAPRRDAPLTHAPLPPAGVWASPATVARWPVYARGIEAEIALRLGEDVSPSQAARLVEGQGAELIDAMAVSIELVESRWLQQFSAPPLLLLADQLCHGALVVGDWQPCDLVNAAPDWSRQVCRLRVGSAEVTEHVGTHSLGDPAWLLAEWLRHATAEYGTLRAGTVVTTGSWVGLVRAQPGERVHAQFEGIGEAWLQF